MAAAQHSRFYFKMKKKKRDLLEKLRKKLFPKKIDSKIRVITSSYKFTYNCNGVDISTYMADTIETRDSCSFLLKSNGNNFVSD